MKIYYSGAHSTGKSTLARITSEIYKLHMISETARMVLSEKELAINTLRADINSVNTYQTEVFYRQISEEEKYTEFVSDRCLIDCLAYSIQHSSISQNLLADIKLKEYIDELKHSNAIIFFIRPSKSIMINDGVREAINWDGMISIDAVIKTLLTIFDIRYFQIDADSIQERIRLINNVIELVK